MSLKVGEESKWGWGVGPYGGRAPNFKSQMAESGYFLKQCLPVHYLNDFFTEGS